MTTAASVLFATGSAILLKKEMFLVLSWAIHAERHCSMWRQFVDCIDMNVVLLSWRDVLRNASLLCPVRE